MIYKFWHWYHCRIQKRFSHYISDEFSDSMWNVSWNEILKVEYHKVCIPLRIYLRIYREMFHGCASCLDTQLWMGICCNEIFVRDEPLPYVGDTVPSCRTVEWGLNRHSKEWMYKQSALESVGVEFLSALGIVHHLLKLPWLQAKTVFYFSFLEPYYLVFPGEHLLI